MTPGYGDFHNHLVPGVDDGSRTLADALHSIDRMVSAGVTRVITTPHLRASLVARREFEEYMVLLDRRWNEVRQAVADAYPDLDFRRGFELRLDTAAPDVSDPRLHLGGTSFILVEWPMFTAPPGASRLLSGVADAGLVPILAHPERYAGIADDLEAARSWKSAGALLQGNYGSLVGQNGTRARRLAFRMLEEGLLDYLSSDFHGRPEYTFHLPGGATELTRRGGGGQLDLLGRVNPRRLFEGRPPHPVPPLRLDAPLAEMLHGFLG